MFWIQLQFKTIGKIGSFVSEILTLNRSILRSKYLDIMVQFSIFIHQFRD